MMWVGRDGAIRLFHQDGGLTDIFSAACVELVPPADPEGILTIAKGAPNVIGVNNREGYGEGTYYNGAAPGTARATDGDRLFLLDYVRLAEAAHNLPVALGSFAVE